MRVARKAPGSKKSGMGVIRADATCSSYGLCEHDGAETRRQTKVRMRNELKTQGTQMSSKIPLAFARKKKCSEL